LGRRRYVTTREVWATQFLRYGGFTCDPTKLYALVAHATAADVGARNNPLASTEPAPGAESHTTVNLPNGDTTHVWDYPSAEEGFSALLATFKNPRYTTLFDVLASPEDGQGASYARSEDLNAWGTGVAGVAAVYERMVSGEAAPYLRAEITGDEGPAIPAPGEYPTIGLGEGGPAVREVQAVLGLPITGSYDDALRLAVVDFQSARGLEADGIVGPATWDALLEPPAPADD
jgi:murein L,D-transpeptidase YcbB/YkuD